MWAAVDFCRAAACHRRRKCSGRRGHSDLGVLKSARHHRRSTTAAEPPSPPCGQASEGTVSPMCPLHHTTGRERCESTNRTVSRIKKVHHQIRCVLRSRAVRAVLRSLARRKVACRPRNSPRNRGKRARQRPPRYYRVKLADLYPADLAHVNPADLYRKMSLHYRSS